MTEKIFIKDIIGSIEAIAPLHWQESYDNAGLIVGNKENECTGVLICLDVFASTVEEAIQKKCNLIVSHHPFIFHGIKKLEQNSPTTAILTLALKHDIAIYSAHTNMDSSAIGVNDILGEKLLLQNISPLDNSKFTTEENYLGEGAIGYLRHDVFFANAENKTANKPVQVLDYLSRIKKDCNLFAIRYCGDENKQINKVGYCGGAGSFLIEKAIQQGCDIFLTGDLKYHDFLSYSDRIVLADIGHFESEKYIKQRFFDIISKKMCNFAPLYITEEENRIKFL